MFCTKSKFSFFVILEITLLSLINCLQITLRSNVCFEIVKPFRDDLKVHYDRDYLLNGGIPKELHSGIFFRGPHKLRGRSQFDVELNTRNERDKLEKSYLYVFFHEDKKYSGCLHDELEQNKFKRVEGPGVPYDVLNGTHGVPSELWVKEFPHNLRIAFQVNSSTQKCEFAVFGAVFTQSNTNFRRHNRLNVISGSKRCTAKVSDFAFVQASDKNFTVKVEI